MKEESLSAFDWRLPPRTIGALAGKYLLRLARGLPPTMRTPLESMVLKVSILRGRRLVPEELLESKFVEAIKLLLESEESIGDYLEFGVYTGTSMACMYRAAKRTNTPSMGFFGFDSFEGLEASVEDEDAGVWESGRYSCPRSVTEWYLRREKVDMDRVELVEGWFRDSLNEAMAQRLNLQKASVVMVDCDNYSAAKQALEFAGKFIQDQCVVFFDDWHSHDLDKKGLGEKRAFDEFLVGHPALMAEPLGSYNRYSEVFLLKSSSSTHRADTLQVV